MRALALFVAQTLAVVSILASLLVLAGRHPLRIDLSPDRSLTLSPHTRQVLGGLRGEVRATAFTSNQEQAIRQQIVDLLRLYSDAQPLVTTRMLDLDRSPGEAERLGVSNYNVVVLESGGRRERVDLVNEDTLTAALLAVGGRPGAVAYVAQGHGEADIRDGEQRGGGGDAAAALARAGRFRASHRSRTTPGSWSSRDRVASSRRARWTRWRPSCAMAAVSWCSRIRGDPGR